MLFSIHKNIAYVFVFTLALTSTNSFGMQKGQYDNTVNYIPFSNRSYLWQPQQPTSMSAYLTHNIHSQFGNGESISSSSAIPVHVFNNCTFNFGQQNLNHSPKKKGRGPGKKTLAKQEELVTNTSFDLNEAGKSIDIARQSGKYELSALVLACSQEYIDLTKDELASSSDQESDSYLRIPINSIINSNFIRAPIPIISEH